MIPLIHDMKGKKVTIFGGGRVALRKASYFHPEAAVTVISRSIGDEIKELGVNCIKKEIPHKETEISALAGDSFVVVAATSDRELNNLIGSVCRKEGILFNNADGDTGDVMVPSVVRGDNYVIAISTEGRSPAVPRYLRKFIEKECAGLDEMIELQSEFREILKEKVGDQQTRNRILREIVEDEEAWRHLETDKRTAMEYIKGKYLR